MVQNKVTSDDIASILDYVDENISEVESSNSENEIGDNKKSNCRSGKDSKQSDRQVATAVSG
jgi:hypothetical protein